MHERKSPALSGASFVLHGGFALFPELHVLHLLTAGALKALAYEGHIDLEPPLAAVGIGIEAVLGEVFAGDELEHLAAFEAGDGLFLDGAGVLAVRDSSSSSLMSLSLIFFRLVERLRIMFTISSSCMTRTEAWAVASSIASLR